jgi:hypothetical protein
MRKMLLATLSDLARKASHNTETRAAASLSKQSAETGSASSSLHACTKGNSGSNENDETSKWPRRGASIVVENEDLALCQRIAKERRDRNAEAGLVDARYAASRRSEDIEFQGVVGELAFNRFFGLDDAALLDTTPRRAATETSFDAILGPNKRTIDVKTTCYANVSLRVSQWKRNNAPYMFSLQTIVFRNVLVGLISIPGLSARQKRAVEAGDAPDLLETEAKSATVTFCGAVKSSDLFTNKNLWVNPQDKKT